MSEQMNEQLNELDGYCERYKGLFNIVNTIKELIVKLKRKVAHQVKSNTQKSEVSSLFYLSPISQGSCHSYTLFSGCNYRHPCSVS